MQRHQWWFCGVVSRPCCMQIGPVEVFYKAMKGLWAPQWAPINSNSLHRPEDRLHTFWCRRWTEQSRSYKWTTLPWLSPRIWTSMWRGRSMNFSRNSAPLPNAACASDLALSKASGTSCCRNEYAWTESQFSISNWDNATHGDMFWLHRQSAAPSYGYSVNRSHPRRIIIAPRFIRITEFWVISDILRFHV